MKKIKKTSRINLSLWLVIGFLGILAVGTVAIGYSGNNAGTVFEGDCIGCFGAAGDSGVVLGGTRFPSGISADSTSPSSGEVRGTTMTSTGLATLASASVTGATTLTGAATLSSTLSVAATTTLEFVDSYKENATTTATVAMTYTVTDSGKTIYIPGTGSTHTLPPATANHGMVFRFIVGEAFGTNMVITADPVASIYGTLDVDSGVLPCQDEDVVTIVASAESLGDYVTFRSNGDNWYVRGVGELTGAMTCTT